MSRYGLRRRGPLSLKFAMDIPDSLIHAARGAHPATDVHSEVMRLRDAGHAQGKLSDWLNSLLVAVRETDPDSEAVDAILEVLDLVEGWCSPAVAMFPSAASANT